MLARTSEELMKHSKTMLVHDATRILREHNFEPMSIRNQDGRYLLVDLVNQEVIDKISDDRRVNTTTLLHWMGY